MNKLGIHEWNKTKEYDIELLILTEEYSSRAESFNSFIMLKSQLLDRFIYFIILITCLSVIFKQALDCVKRYDEQETSVNHELQR